MKKLKILLASAVVLFVGLQFYRPEIPSPPVTNDFTGPEEIKKIFKKSCYDCHSNETNLAWFDQINPAFLLVRKHILEGRSYLNFSDWDKLNDAKRRLLLFDALNVVKTFKTMPLPEYTLLHPEAKLSKTDVDKLEKFILSLEKYPVEMNASNKSKSEKITGSSIIKNAPNGIKFIPDYKDWQVISTTERFDHNSTRIIYANDIAVNAINKGNNIPYPDGSILAKALWERVTNENGDIVPGKFIHVEFMIKDEEKYASTKGWGWARWLGNELKPFGNDEKFANSCVNCHNPVKEMDYTFTPAIRFSKNK